jgi:hypothetical protein
MKKKNRAPRKKSELSRTRQTARATRGAASRKAGAANKEQKAAGANRSEGIRLFQLAGRPTKEQFTKVYGEGGPRMTWAQRAAAGIPAEKFQAALASAMRK